MKKNDETYLQIYLVSFLKKLQLAGYDFMFFHVPNGGSRSKAEASKFKMMGVLPGVPDLCLIAANKLQFIELKASKGKTSKEQDDFINKTNIYGFKTHIVKADCVRSAINQVSEILISEFNFDHQGISKCSSTVLKSTGEA